MYLTEWERRLIHHAKQVEEAAEREQQAKEGARADLHVIAESIRAGGSLPSVSQKPRTPARKGIPITESAVKRFETERKRRGLEYRGAADQIKIGDSSLYRFTHRVPVSAATLKSIAQFCRVKTVEELLS
jgi:hypothetical protein